VGPNDAIAFVVFMATLGAVLTSFSPVGRALADRLRGKPREPTLDPAELEALRDELAGVRRQVDELAERQDFTERLLAQARERGLLNPPKER
jgi:ubiquinone biosynthesis protein UbiJ